MARTKSPAPQPQRARTSPKNAGERKTARPSKRAKMDTPRVPVAPPPLERKKPPRI
jgi:hypothetical protein